jgi:gas vesicle protein
MTAYEIEQGSDGMHPGMLIVGILVGGLAGALTSLLLAPHSGKDTRDLIKTKAIVLRDNTTASVGKVSGQVRTKADQIKTNVSTKTAELTQQGKQALAKQLDRLSTAAQKGSSNLIGKTSE